MTGAATKSELARALILEQDVGGLDHVGIIGREIGHLDDAPFALEAYGQPRPYYRSAAES